MSSSLTVTLTVRLTVVLALFVVAQGLELHGGGGRGTEWDSRFATHWSNRKAVHCEQVTEAMRTNGLGIIPSCLCCRW